jgi:predicted N-formylglutamate amidohydrolase
MSLATSVANSVCSSEVVQNWVSAFEQEFVAGASRFGSMVNDLFKTRLECFTHGIVKRVESSTDDRFRRSNANALPIVGIAALKLRDRKDHGFGRIGVCYETNDALSRCILKVLETEPGLNVGNNQPYGVDVETSYSVPVYGEEQGHPYAEFEIRQDLISDRAGQRQWAQRIARVLLEAHSLFRQRS